MGLSLIPIKPGTKMPDVGNEWQRFCDRLPTEEECDRWERSGARGYGLTLGRASRVLAVDIDTDDPRVLEAVKPSPVRKRGRKGETRFFRYDPEVQSCKVAGIIDVLSHGRQTLLPPTVHPETGKPYHWVTPDTLEGMTADELPEFTAKDLSDLRSALETQSTEAISTAGVQVAGGPWRNDDPKRLSPHGSHDRLKCIANALIARGASPDEAIRELIRYDEENHLPVGYFRDQTRGDCFADPVSNALFFYASNMKTFNRRQVVSGGAPAVPTISGSELLDVSALAPAGQAWRQTAWPEPKGGLRLVRELMRGASYRDIPALSLGGAISLGAAVVSNRLKLKDSWPNCYVLNVAGTGSGKNTPYKVIKRILSPEHGLDHLIGSGGYKSSPAIVKDLLGRRERLDLIDECSALFDMIRTGGSFQSDMIDVLNMLWTDSSTLFIGPEGMMKEKVSVWHPCVSALLSTTPLGLSSSVNKGFMSKGFLPRTLIFHEAEYGAYRDEPVLDEGALARAVSLFAEVQAVSGDQAGKRNLMAPKPDPREIPIDRAGDALLRDYWRRQAEDIEKDMPEFERDFMTRRGEHVTKLSLIHGALNGLRVNEDDVRWAIDTVAAVWHNSLPLLPTLSAENAQESNTMRVLAIIRKAGSVEHSHLIGRTRFLKTPERNEILASLEAEGKIRGTLSKTSGKVWHTV
jgi:hypothetical protein